MIKYKYQCRIRSLRPHSKNMQLEFSQQTVVSKLSSANCRLMLVHSSLTVAINIVTSSTALPYCRLVTESITRIAHIREIRRFLPDKYFGVDIRIKIQAQGNSSGYYHQD